jgi:hypothetical protein
MAVGVPVIKATLWLLILLALGSWVLSIVGIAGA